MANEVAVVDIEKCKKCQLERCPVLKALCTAVEMINSDGKQVLEINHERCRGCGECLGEENKPLCPSGAVSLQDVKDDDVIQTG